jgi:hypothetical protein
MSSGMIIAQIRLYTIWYKWHGMIVAVKFPLTSNYHATKGQGGMLNRTNIVPQTVTKTVTKFFPLPWILGHFDPFCCCKGVSYMPTHLVSFVKIKFPLFFSNSHATVFPPSYAIIVPQRFLGLENLGQIFRVKKKHMQLSCQHAPRLF